DGEVPAADGLGQRVPASDDTQPRTTCSPRPSPVATCLTAAIAGPAVLFGLGQQREGHRQPGLEFVEHLRGGAAAGDEGPVVAGPGELESAQTGQAQTAEFEVVKRTGR